MSPAWFTLFCSCRGVIQPGDGLRVSPPFRTHIALCATIDVFVVVNFQALLVLQKRIYNCCEHTTAVLGSLNQPACRFQAESVCCKRYCCIAWYATTDIFFFCFQAVSVPIKLCEIVNQVYSYIYNKPRFLYIPRNIYWYIQRGDKRRCYFQAILIPRGRHRASEEHHRSCGRERHEPLPQHQALRGEVRPGNGGALQRRLLFGLVRESALLLRRLTSGDRLPEELLDLVTSGLDLGS